MTKIRPLKVFLLVVVAALLALTAYGISTWRPCSGWRDCYFSFRLFKSGTGRLDGERQRAIYQFTASSMSVAFPVPLATGEAGLFTGLLFIDRATHQLRLIQEDAASFYAPRLSWDNERLLFVRKRGGQRDLLSCLVKTWRCRLVVRTDASVSSPVEIDKDTIVYSSSPLITGADDRKRYSRHDFYWVNVGGNPIRLSNIEWYQLDSINISGDRVLFSAVGPRQGNVVAPKYEMAMGPRSEIFEMKIDKDAHIIASPAGALQPQFLVGGLSVTPSMSQDGGRVAFLNTKTNIGTYRYNLMVVDIASGRRKLIDLKGIAFSPAAFAGESLVYNELFADRYVVSAWHFPSGAVQTVAEVNFSDINTDSLESISLTLDSPSVGQNR